MRSLAALILVLLVAAPAAAQSKVESFTTAYDAAAGHYLHQTVYEFDVPSPVGSSGAQQTLSTADLLLDIYWNTRRVFLAVGAIDCWARERNEWVVVGGTISTTHIATVRTAMDFGTSCRARLVFINNQDPRYATTPQKGAVRFHVASTTGGLLTVTKSHADARGVRNYSNGTIGSPSLADLRRAVR